METTIIEQLDRIERNSLLAAKNVLSFDDVITITGLSKSYLYQLTSKHMIPHYKKANHLYFDRNEIEDWLKTDRIGTMDEAQLEANKYLTRKGGKR